MKIKRSSSSARSPGLRRQADRESRAGAGAAFTVDGPAVARGHRADESQPKAAAGRFALGGGCAPERREQVLNLIGRDAGPRILDVDMPGPAVERQSAFDDAPVRTV